VSDQKSIRVADYIAARVVAAGVRHAFMITGGGAMHLNDAFAREAGLGKVFFHHEQGAAIAAESYNRYSGRMALLNVTTGPGGINALNGVHGAYVDSLAMLVVSGQVKRETYARNYDLNLRQLGDQEVDIRSMAWSIVKYATVLQDPAEVRRVMDKALFLAVTGRPGPVWIDVPVDVQGALVDPDALAGFDTGDVRTLAADPDVTPNTREELLRARSADLEPAIIEILARLAAAKRPVLFLGGGVRISGMHAACMELVDALRIPVVTGWNAHDALTNESDYYAGRPGTVGDRAGNFAVQNADFMLVLGSRLNIRQISYNWKSFARDAWLAMVDVDSAELAKPTLRVSLPVCAALQDFIPALLASVAMRAPVASHARYLARCRRRVLRYPTVLPEYAGGERINPYWFLQKFFDALREDDVVVTGNGSACVIAFQAARLRRGQRLYTNSGSASMGYDVPAAIGAAVARGGGRIICIAGDGSVMMNLQELQTMVGYRLPIKVLILNNEGYHSIRLSQETHFPDNLHGIGPDTGVTFPDFVRIGQAFGIESRRIARRDGLDDALGWFLDGDPDRRLLEVVVDREQPFSPKLSSRRLPDGTMVAPSLEDMAPFLPRDELAENMSQDDEV
jgi:acetolactate synthase-1/2/3 large subunit